ncbi:MAG: hypothetical protein HC824_11380 [Synechococcales cyanobacterium RM1_1_8]|nr:hypothetical protein [Synechococcales cyanobacterium RM1_1_8]
MTWRATANLPTPAAIPSVATAATSAVCYTMMAEFPEQVNGAIADFVNSLPRMQPRRSP